MSVVFITIVCLVLSTLANGLSKYNVQIFKEVPKSHKVGVLPLQQQPYILKSQVLDREENKLLLSQPVERQLEEIFKKGYKIIHTPDGEPIELIPGSQSKRLDDLGVKPIVYEFGSRPKYDDKPFLIANYDLGSMPFEDEWGEFKYPKEPQDDTKPVTYVRVKVIQTTDQGFARITSGAIGTKAITILIKAFKTSYFSYSVELYSELYKNNDSTTSPIVEKIYTFGKTTPNDIVLDRITHAEEYTKNIDSAAIIKNDEIAGREITAVIIRVKQTSVLGIADAIEGALGSGLMRIELVAQNTKMFSYEAVFYTRATDSDDLQSFVYEFGSRTKYDDKEPFLTTYYKPGNMLLQDIWGEFKYPKEPQDLTKRVTYVRIKVLQSSDQGFARITNGAIGTKAITIMIKAFKTFHFSYTVELYSSSIAEKTYTFGEATSHDVVLDHINYTTEYTKNIDSTKTIMNGVRPDKIITFVAIRVRQTSDLGSANVISGGLGTGLMRIKLVAENTKMLSYEAIFYTAAADLPPCPTNNYTYSNTTEKRNDSSKSSAAANLSFSILLACSLQFVLVVYK